MFTGSSPIKERGAAMKRQIAQLTNFVIFCLAAQQANAAEGESAVYPQEWKNVWSSSYSRALGGSQTAHAFNEDALFANPAALNKTRHPRSRAAVHVVDVPGLSVGGNSTALSSFKGKALKPSEWLKSLATLSSAERNYFELQMLPWAVLGERGGPTFFVGMPVRSTLIAPPSADNGVSRSVFLESTATAALNMSLASRTGATAFGLSLRPNMRWTSESTYNLADAVSSKSLFAAIKTNSHKTTSTAADLGFIVTAGDFWMPSFALSVLNLPTGCVENFVNPATGKSQSICGAKRSGDVKDDIEGTRLDPTEVRMGVSIVPRIRIGGARLNLKVSGDIYPLPISYRGKNYGFQDVNINQLTHAGVELFLGNALSSRTFSIRGGLNDTRVSWGFAIPLPHFNVEMTSYEAPIFTQGKADKERRYLLGLSSHW
ncbi:MAG: hypothetical protein RLZZ488_1994 [Pseudomonadota bacterium]|jgi:hypothetical protein